MPDRCSYCGEDFVRESGFYWGAMMVSHATTTILAVAVHGVFYYFYGWSEVVVSIITFITLMLILIPVIFRSSRAIWINFFVDYDALIKKM